MANTAYTTVTNASQLPKRILANLKAQVSWIDSTSGETISITGMTEHISETGALVNIEVLPLVGSSVHLRLFNEGKTIVETETEVIRVERDPSKPMVALSIVENLKAWRDKAMIAGQEWVTRNWRLNYGEDWAN
ncbi:MAG: PilZ domain-containing protein [Acidobacteria bacterium]|nr:PilZ domain-containing protein [Acidobacteriota bacterium]